MPFGCEICKENFRLERHLEKHRVNAHCKPYPNICELCGKGFINFRFKEAWETHKKYCGKERKTRCDICSKNFKKTDGYNRHMKSHTKQRDFHCIQCDKEFADKRNLLNHTEKMHTKADQNCD